MTTLATPRRESATARRVGYAIAVAVNAALLYLVNVSPGWRTVPFLTDGTTDVLPWVNASFVAAIVANSLYALVDARWFRAAGEILVTSVGLAALVRFWQAFPFAFDSDGLPWDVVVRWVLAVGAVGSVIGIIVNAVTLARSLGPARARA